MIFHNSTFGDGKYPIVYSKIACGGWETKLKDCSNEEYPKLNCSRNNVAGVLCGYGIETYFACALLVYLLSQIAVMVR